MVEVVCEEKLNSPVLFAAASKLLCYAYDHILWLHVQHVAAQTSQHLCLLSGCVMLPHTPP